jgi:DNA (cytosine-5)-methyltransferase 1
MGRQNKPTAVDLFSGAGGLSLGLAMAGFDVVSAVEINEAVAKTYEANHPRTNLIIDDIRNVSGKKLLKKTKRNKVTLVAGCPPCQGFSSLTRKYHKHDSRNGLVLEMARIIEEIGPDMVMMENVPGLATRGKRVFNKFIRRLERKGYVVNWKVLQLADYGIPQTRSRLVLLAGRGFGIQLPEQTRAYKADTKHGLQPRLNVRDAIGKMMGKAVTLSYAIEHGGPQKFNWHVVRDLKPISIERLKTLKSGEDRYDLPNKLRPKCHINSKKGFQNVYGRMSWKQTPPTITSGCTTPCMGRFGHPQQLRTISVREAALIQTFPKTYKFKTEYMDTACDLVGNALPPKFAMMVGRQCISSYASYNMTKMM